MGLDMYLTASRYIGGGWDHAADADKKAFVEVLGVVGLERSQAENSVTVDVGVGYWRKANAIHAWFVRECQGGVDECQKASVDREKLQELREVCSKVLASSVEVEGNVLECVRFEPGKRAKRVYRAGKVVNDPSSAIELLPSQGGFFFGGTDYDEGYLQDLRDTIAICDKCLALPECWYFSYQSSW